MMYKIRFYGGILDGLVKTMEFHGERFHLPTLEKLHRGYIMPDGSTGHESACEIYEVRYKKHRGETIIEAVFKEKIEYLKPKNAVYLQDFLDG